MRATLLIIALGVDWPCRLSKRRLERRAAGHWLDDASRRRDVDGRACANRDSRSGDSDRRCARRRPRRPGRRIADGRRPPGGVAGAGGGARFGSEALVARGQRRIRLCRAGGRGGRRLPRLFANHLCRRPAEPRQGRRLPAAGRKLEDDELRLQRRRSRAILGAVSSHEVGSSFRASVSPRIGSQAANSQAAKMSDNGFPEIDD